MGLRPIPLHPPPSASRLTRLRTFAPNSERLRERVPSGQSFVMADQGLQVRPARLPGALQFACLPAGRPPRRLPQVTRQRHFRNPERGLQAASMPNHELTRLSMRKRRQMRTSKRRERRAPADQRQVSL